MFEVSIGRNRFDARPEQHAPGTFKAFAKLVLSRRATDKASAGYLCAPFGGDGRRSAANALPRAWLALDIDGIDRDVLPEWRMHLAGWRVFGWATASSTPDAPRERAIVELSRPVDREEGTRLGALILRDTAEIFGAAVRIDPCGFRAEQPAFLAPVGVQAFFGLGDALNVETWLAQAPPAPPPPPPAMGEVAELADLRMRRVVEQLADAGLLRAPLPNERGYSVHCPWEKLHTTPSTASSTAILFPSEANGWRGGFRCLHAHCNDRGLRDLARLLEDLERAAA